MKSISLLFTGFALLAAGANAATVNLAWDANSETNIAGYKLYYGNTVSRSYTFTNDFGNVLTGSATNLANSSRYFFGLTAYNTLGLESDFSAEVIGLTPVPNVPNLSVTNRTTNSITLAWSAPAPNILRYFISGGVTNSTTNTTFVATGLAAGQSYTFSVVASNVFGTTSIGSLIVGSTLAPPAPPAGLRILTILQSSTGNMGAPWVAEQTNEFIPLSASTSTVYRAELKIIRTETAALRTPLSPPLPPNFR